MKNEEKKSRRNRTTWSHSIYSVFLQLVNSDKFNFTRVSIRMCEELMHRDRNLRRELRHEKSSLSFLTSFQHAAERNSTHRFSFSNCCTSFRLLFFSMNWLTICNISEWPDICVCRRCDSEKLKFSLFSHPIAYSFFLLSVAYFLFTLLAGARKFGWIFHRPNIVSFISLQLIAQHFAVSNYVSV